MHPARKSGTSTISKQSTPCGAPARHASALTTSTMASHTAPRPAGPSAPCVPAPRAVHASAHESSLAAAASGRVRAPAEDLDSLEAVGDCVPSLAAVSHISERFCHRLLRET